MKRIKLEDIRPQGVRKRLTLSLVSFVGFVILLLWLFQIVLLDDFYHQYKLRQVRQTASLITRNLDHADLADLVNRLAAYTETCILLIDEDGQVIVNADILYGCRLHHLTEDELAEWRRALDQSTSPITDLYVSPDDRVNPNNINLSGGFPDENTRTNTLILYGTCCTLPGGKTGYLLINTLVTPVDSTVATLRSQLLSITVIVLAAALLLAVSISRHISRPIIQTNAAAKDLAHGSFTSPIQYKTYREITELNATLAAAAQELNQVEKLQHELVANISHDLRTPLTMIGGYAEMMRDIPSEMTPENMQIIIDESARLSSLVNELLDFSRMQSGGTVLRPVNFCLTDAVESIITRIGKLTAKDGYVIHFSPAQYVTTHADESCISQVIYNLLGNALTYSGADKTVTVTQELRGSHARISIHDGGAGIAPDELPFIWNRYYRTRETHKRAVVGSGLGLNIVRVILDLHGTPYGVESNESTGTTFWFELPLAESFDD